VQPVTTEKLSWFAIALRLRDSVILTVLPRVLLCGGFGVLISVLYAWKLPISWLILGSLIPNLVLGLLLVFRQIFNRRMKSLPVIKYRRGFWVM
jgi:ion channel-forming bestrophin family protein